MDKYTNTHVRKYKNTQNTKIGLNQQPRLVQLWAQRTLVNVVILTETKHSQIKSNSLIFFLKGIVAFL